MKKASQVPHWLELQFEIDYLLFQMGEMYKREVSLSGLERMIDEATGFDKEKLRRAKRIHNKIIKLQKEYFSLPGLKSNQ